MTRLAARFVFASLVVTAPSVSLAQSAPPAAPPTTSSAMPSPPDDTARQQAREHFTRGVQLIQEARWLDAISELEAAREIRVTPPVLYNLGLAQRAVGRNREAVQSFRGFLTLAGANRNPDLARQAETYIRELSTAIGQLELRVEPANAAISIDGRAASTVGSRVEVDPGRHVIVARADGYAPETRAVDVPRGGTAVVVMRMVQTASAAHLRVESNVREALIRIDGHDVGFGNADENLREGHHVIEVRAARHATFRREYDAFAGTSTTMHAVLEDQRTVFERPLFWVITGVVLAGAAATTVILLSGVDPPYRGSWGVVSNAITVGEPR
jgi:hypothetical protein